MNRAIVSQAAPALLGIAVMAALACLGCPKNLRTEGGDVHLTGTAGEVFRKLTGAGAITLSDTVAIYGTENPPSARIKCHERVHQGQARAITYQLLHPRTPDGVEMTPFIDDDPESRAMAWIGVYLVDWLQYGYAKNRWEKEAREVCKDIDN